MLLLIARTLETKRLPVRLDLQVQFSQQMSLALFTNSKNSMENGAKFGEERFTFSLPLSSFRTGDFADPVFSAMNPDHGLRSVFSLRDQHFLYLVPLLP